MGLQQVQPAEDELRNDTSQQRESQPQRMAEKRQPMKGNSKGTLGKARVTELTMRVMVDPSPAPA
jgi:hypothetical protein